MAGNALPPSNFLHVWWAQRPLVASRAAVLASVLPAGHWGALMRVMIPGPVLSGHPIYRTKRGVGHKGCAVIARGAVPPTRLQDEVAQARSHADASRAASNRRAYEADWTRFTIWCQDRGLTHLPADPRVVALFLSGEAARGCAPPTVNRRLAAVGWAHRRAGLQPP